MSNDRSPRALCSTTMGMRGDMPYLQIRNCVVAQARPQAEHVQPCACVSSFRRDPVPEPATRTVERSVVLPLPAEEAWEVVTEREHLEGWLAREVELDLRPGGEGRFRLDDGSERDAVVESVD